MGITESKILLGKLTTACSAAEQNGKSQVQHILLDKQFVNCLAKLWKNLPECSKQQIHSPGRKRIKNKSKKPQTERIHISESLQSNIDSWSNDHRSFLDIKRSTEYSSAAACPIATIYQGLVDAETRSSGDMIRLRFLKVLFHHLQDRFCITYLRLSSVEWMTRRVMAAGLDGSDAEKISLKIKDWAYVGARYDGLCRELGCCDAAQDYRYLGNLFRLPSNFTDRFMLKELTVKGMKREAVIGSLLRRGVCELEQNAVMDKLANDIFSSLWDRIESSVQSEQGEDGNSFNSLQDWRCLQGTRAFRLQSDGYPIANSVPNLEVISSSTSPSCDGQVASFSNGSVLLAGVNRTPLIPVDVRDNGFGMQSNTSLASPPDISETWDQACFDQPSANLSMGRRGITRATIELPENVSGTDIANKTASQCAPVCANVDQRGLSGSVTQIEDYSNGRGLQPPKGPSVAYESMLEAAHQNMSISGNEETTYQTSTREIENDNAESVAWGSGQLHNEDNRCPQDGNMSYQSSACGFDNYEPVAFVQDLLYNQDHGRPQDASVPYQTSARGFDNYDAESALWRSGQLYNQDHGRPQDASVPYQTSARGFDNYDAESIAWGSGQLHNQDPGDPQDGNMHYQSSACGFDNYEPVALGPDQLYNQDHERPRDANVPYRNLAHEPNNIL